MVGAQMTDMTKPDIEAIRQSPRQYVDLETVEALSDYAMVLEQQLADSKKQNVLLRDVLVNAHEFIGDSVESYEPAKQRIDALTATVDLKGCIICDAKPVGEVETHTGSLKDMAIIVWCGDQPAEGTKLYKARKP